METYLNPSQAAAQKSSCDTLAPSGDLLPILERIRYAADGAMNVSQRLSDHADRVHGPQPESCIGAVGSAAQGPTGIIGQLHVALDYLEAAQSQLASAANRNCTLA